jgi:hypothetical protein
MNGYLHPRYAWSLAEFGRPRRLPRCGGWILERRIPGLADRDAMGCYPLFACQDWSGLERDLAEIKDEGRIVSLALVTDPFGEYEPAFLLKCFGAVLPFKDHFVVDLRRSINECVSKHHRYYARKALEKVAVDMCTNPLQFLDEWLSLYATLIERHRLVGIKAFSRLAFARQLSVPGLVVFRAQSQGIPVGAHLWYVQRDVAYSHLAASSPLGYELMASYALYWSAITYFADQVHWLDLGGGAGIRRKNRDGLSQFKRGWSTGTRTAYLCGLIVDPQRYEDITRRAGLLTAGYFPAYRGYSHYPVDEKKLCFFHDTFQACET